MSLEQVTEQVVATLKRSAHLSATNLVDLFILLQTPHPFSHLAAPGFCASCVTACAQTTLLAPQLLLLLRLPAASSCLPLAACCLLPVACCLLPAGPHGYCAGALGAGAGGSGGGGGGAPVRRPGASKRGHGVARAQSCAHRSHAPCQTAHALAREGGAPREGATPIGGEVRSMELCGLSRLLPLPRTTPCVSWGPGDLRTGTGEKS